MGLDALKDFSGRFLGQEKMIIMNQLHKFNHVGTRYSVFMQTRVRGLKPKGLAEMDHPS
jgi:hypothetical protein